MITAWKKGENFQVTTHFNTGEFDCKCNYKNCYETLIDSELLEALEKLRINLRLPIHINSGFRCKKHNKDIKGETNSKHLLGMAADIALPEGMRYEDFYKACENIKDIKGIGKYSDKNFVHVDTRIFESRWGK